MKKFSFLIVLLVLIVGGILAWWITNTAPANPFDKTVHSFSVKNGDGIREIANNLKTEGLIKDPVAFFLLVKQQGRDSKIQAGDFQLSPDMSSEDIAKALEVGTFDTRITIPEGKRADEIADMLQEHYPAFQESWRTTLQDNEGYLFPDTYSFAKDATIEQIVATMRENFEKKYAAIPNTNKSSLSKEKLVIIASMVEREARFAQDRPLVASVIFNRLAINMGLQLDATVQYALGYQPAEKTWWKKNLTLQDLDIKSPYNTYDNTGLPPTPIANPGIQALTAVLEAPETDYIYYITDPKTGKNVYARTLEEHNANIKKYGLE